MDAFGFNNLDEGAEAGWLRIHRDTARSSWGGFEVSIYCSISMMGSQSSRLHLQKWRCRSRMGQIFMSGSFGFATDVNVSLPWEWIRHPRRITASRIMIRRTSQYWETFLWKSSRCCLYSVSSCIPWRKTWMGHCTVWFTTWRFLPKKNRLKKHVSPVLFWLF